MGRKCSPAHLHWQLPHSHGPSAPHRAGGGQVTQPTVGAGAHTARQGAARGEQALGHQRRGILLCRRHATPRRPARLLAAAREGLGYSVLQAHGGAAAIRALAEAGPAMQGRREARLRVCRLRWRRRWVVGRSKLPRRVRRRVGAPVRGARQGHDGGNSGPQRATASCGRTAPARLPWAASLALGGLQLGWGGGSGLTVRRAELERSTSMSLAVTPQQPRGAPQSAVAGPRHLPIACSPHAGRWTPRPAHKWPPPRSTSLPPRRGASPACRPTCSSTGRTARRSGAACPRRAARRRPRLPPPAPPARRPSSSPRPPSPWTRPPVAAARVTAATARMGPRR